jgi:hypothetical protein
MEAFPPDSLLLFSSRPDFENLCVSPTPTFFEGDELTAVHTPRPGQAGLAPLTDRETLPLELPVRLVPDPGPTPSTAALVLDVEEMAWVRRLLYRLPGEAFGAYRLCLGQERAVLLGEGLPVEALPFGVPLRRVQDTQLFIPLRARFAPDLPWALLAESLELKEGVYTFLTPDFRLDVPHSAFAPLSRALVADPGRPRVAFQVRPAPTLPSLHWTPPPRPEQRAALRPDGKSERAKLTERVLGRREQPKPEPPPGKPGSVVIRPAEPQDVEGLLRERGESYRQAGDFLSAALCFALADDAGQAGRCYQRVAQASLGE